LPQHRVEDPERLARYVLQDEKLAHRAIFGHWRSGATPRAAGLARPEGLFHARRRTRGCSIPALNSTGGNGYFYCFAAN